MLLFLLKNTHINICAWSNIRKGVFLVVLTCWGLCRDCSELGWLVSWWKGWTHTLVELVLTQTAALQTED